MFFYRASLSVSSAALRFVSGVIRAHHRVGGDLLAGVGSGPVGASYSGVFA